MVGDADGMPKVMWEFVCTEHTALANVVKHRVGVYNHHVLFDMTSSQLAEDAFLFVPCTEQFVDAQICSIFVMRFSTIL